MNGRKSRELRRKANRDYDPRNKDHGFDVKTFYRRLKKMYSRG